MSPEPDNNSAAVPIPGRQNILITSALPYVNDVPHLGNIIGSVLSADVFSRYCRARGINTMHIGGTDEYGTATEIRAAQEGCTPKELCDRFHQVHADIYRWFNISFDKFGRTTTQNQTEIAQDIFSKVYENGFLDEHVTTRLFCESCARFLADRYVVGDCPRCGKDARGDECDRCGSFDDAIELKNPRCNLERCGSKCGSTPTTRDTKHLFFRLDRLEPQVREFFDDSVYKGKWSSNGKGEAEGWFKRGLKERSITRDIKFGTPVPPSLSGYEDKVIYNWFDAPIGYISITAEYTDDWRAWWQPENPDDVQLYQFIGKDNVFFHSIFFPASQIATEKKRTQENSIEEKSTGRKWTKVHHLSTTDYLQYEGAKFSKSRGVGVFGDKARASGIKADAWRFYLVYHRPETSDTEFTWDTFKTDVNTILNNNLGNLVNRVVKFVNKPLPAGFGGVVPGVLLRDDHGGSVRTREREIKGFLTEYIDNLDAVRLRPALVAALGISGVGNDLAQAASRLAETDREECGAVYRVCLNIVHLLAALLRPFLPDTADCIAKQLGVGPVVTIPDMFSCDAIRPGHRIGEAECLFERIFPDRAEELKAECGGIGLNGVKGSQKKGKGKNCKNDEKKSVASGDQ